MLEITPICVRGIKCLVVMRKYLLWWRNLSKEEKQSLMTERNIKAITYSDIKTVYAERGK